MLNKKLKIEELEKLAIEIREEIIKMLLEAKSGHSAGSLGAVWYFNSFIF